MKKHLLLLFLLLSVNCEVLFSQENTLDSLCFESFRSYRENTFHKNNVSYMCVDGLPQNINFAKNANIISYSLYNIRGLPRSFKKKLRHGFFSYFFEINLKENCVIIVLSVKKAQLLDNNIISLQIYEQQSFLFTYSNKEKKWVLKDV